MGNTTGFVGDCPSFGKITWQGREAHALLFMENLGAFNHAVGYSVLQDGVFTPYQRLFNISKVNLELITAAQALVECTLSPWNTSGHVARRYCVRVSGILAGDRRHFWQDP